MILAGVAVTLAARWKALGGLRDAIRHGPSKIDRGCHSTTTLDVIQQKQTASASGQRYAPKSEQLLATHLASVEYVLLASDHSTNAVSPCVGCVILPDGQRSFLVWGRRSGKRALKPVNGPLESVFETLLDLRDP